MEDKSNKHATVTMTFNDDAEPIIYHDFKDDNLVEALQAENKRLREAYKILKDNACALKLMIKNNTCSDGFRVDMITSSIKEAQSALEE